MNSNNFMRVRVQKKYFLSSSLSAAKMTEFSEFESAALPHLRFIRKEQKNSSENLVESIKKGHHVRRSPIFRPKSSEEQKKRSSRAQAVV